MTHLVMETWYYEVVSIDGDYANLRRTDIQSDDLKLVALALLPSEIVEGSFIISGFRGIYGKMRGNDRR